MKNDIRIEYSKKAVKYINSLDNITKKRIKNGIEGLTEQPPKGDIKHLRSYSDCYRLRIGKYRIIFRYETDLTVTVLYIIDVNSRGDIYK